MDWTGLSQSLCDCAVLCVAVKLCGLDRIATEFGDMLSYVWRSSFVDWTGLSQSLCAVLCVAVSGQDCHRVCVAVKLCGLDRIATEFV